MLGDPFGTGTGHMTTLAPVGAQPRTSVSDALPGVIAGGVVGAGVAAATMKGLKFPIPVALIAGAVIGGPIAGVSLLNNTGEPGKLWQSALVGAGPLAVVGGALGAFGTAFDGGSLGVGIAAGAISFGLVGAGIGALAHAATKPD